MGLWVRKGGFKKMKHSQYKQYNTDNRILRFLSFGVGGGTSLPPNDNWGHNCFVLNANDRHYPKRFLN